MKLGTTISAKTVNKSIESLFLKRSIRRRKKDLIQIYNSSENIRARIRVLLGKNKVTKPRTDKLIGCSLDEFIVHLQKYFYDGMSLDNYGSVWNLDHIVPCSWFDLTKINQLKACTHYTNIQPLLISHNGNKSNKLDWVHPKSGYQITFLRLIHSKFLTLPE